MGVVTADQFGKKNKKYKYREDDGGVESVTFHNFSLDSTHMNGPDCSSMICLT